MKDSKLIKIVKAKKWIPAYYKRVKGRKVLVKGHYTTITKKELDKEELEKFLVTTTVLTFVLGTAVYIKKLTEDIERRRNNKRVKNEV